MKYDICMKMDTQEMIVLDEINQTIKINTSFSIIWRTYIYNYIYEYGICLGHETKQGKKVS